MNQSQIAHEAQNAILSVFREHFKYALCQPAYRYATQADLTVTHNVVPAEEDAGGWCHNAHVIIYHVDGMPSIEHIEMWGQVSDILDGYYVEAINPEVSAIFSL